MLCLLYRLHFRYERTTHYRKKKILLPKLTFDFSKHIPKEIPDSMICKVCYNERLEVLFIPCGHIATCISCSVTVNCCALCRKPFYFCLRIFMDEKKEILDSNVACSDCNTCGKEKMSVVFIPCKHISNCFECAVKNTECLTCNKTFYALIQVYI